MFETGREAYQPVGDAKLGARLRRQALMRGRGRMGDEAFRIAEIVGDAHQLERIEEAEGGGLTAIDLKGDQRRSGAHLLAHHLGLWMIGPPRIDHAGNLWMIDERDRHGCRGVGLPAYAYR